MPRRNPEERVAEKLEEEVEEEVKEEVLVEVDNVTKKKQKCSSHQGEQRDSGCGNTDCCYWIGDYNDDLHFNKVKEKLSKNKFFLKVS